MALPSTPVCYPISSDNPSTSRAISSSARTPIRFPSRSTEIVRICEVFTHDGFGIKSAGKATVSGNPARCAWLVIAITITVSERLFKISWLKTSTEIGPINLAP